MLPISPELLTDRQRLVEVLAQELVLGHLVLQLGSGASSGFGLPSWKGLVKECLRGIGEVAQADAIDDRTDFVSLTRMIDLVRQRHPDITAYHEFIRRLLYANYGKSIANNDASSSDDEWYGIVRNRRLIHAIGTLLTGSRRGRVSDVLTYNYDDVLESYLKWHGYIADTICDWPATIGDADVRVYHLHGFLPQVGQVPTEEIIFSAQSYEQKWPAGLSNNWSRIFRHFLDSKFMLSVGVSATDPSFGVIGGNQLSSSTGAGGTFGVWLMGPDTLITDLNHLRRRKMAAIRFEDFAQIPEFILDVSRAAMALYQRR